MQQTGDVEMWDSQKSSRFQELRDRQDAGGLTPVEQAELADLTKSLEDAEAAYLAPAIQRLDRQRREIESKDVKLDALASRKEALALRLRNFLTEAEKERTAIENELSTVLAEGGSPTGDI